MSPDSPFTQRRNPPIKMVQEVQVSPGNNEVDFFLNLYRDDNGGLVPGDCAYPSEAHAEDAVEDLHAPYYVGTMMFTATLDDEA